ncbi:hypothetical protein C2E23DRAFT_419042 [Lenzites betulinus]|nr:hypothetical protein C2E23DRAFT_419042 [Lenzites betulinus]
MIANHVHTTAHMFFTRSENVCRYVHHPKPTKFVSRLSGSLVLPRNTRPTAPVSSRRPLEVRPNLVRRARMKTYCSGYYCLQPEPDLPPRAISGRHGGDLCCTRRLHLSRASISSHIAPAPSSCQDSDRTQLATKPAPPRARLIDFERTHGVPTCTAPRRCWHAGTCVVHFARSVPHRSSGNCVFKISTPATLQRASTHHTRATSPVRSADIGRTSGSAVWSTSASVRRARCRLLTHTDQIWTYPPAHRSLLIASLYASYSTISAGPPTGTSSCVLECHGLQLSQSACSATSSGLTCARVPVGFILPSPSTGFGFHRRRQHSVPWHSGSSALSPSPTGAAAAARRSRRSAHAPRRAVAAAGHPPEFDRKLGSRARSCGSCYAPFVLRTSTGECW